MTVSVGLGVQRTPNTKAIVGGRRLSANRAAYDKRRRRDADDADTARYKVLLAADPCSFCSERELGVVADRDHIVPLLSGGVDDWTNLTAACKRCNRGRKDTPVLHYMLRRLAR